MNHLRSVAAQAGGIVLGLGFLLLACSCGSDGVKPASGPKADLVVTRMVTHPEEPDTSEAITVTVFVRNRGEVTSAASRTSLSIDGITTCAEIPTRALAPGDSDSVACEIGRRAEAFHSLQACCDVTSAVAESSETNNCGDFPLQVQGGRLPSDLLVRSISFSPRSPVTSERVRIRIAVVNQGAGSSPKSRTAVTVGGVVFCNAIDTPAVASGDSAIVFCEVQEPTRGDYSVRACADAPAVVIEENEENNCCWPEILVVRDPETTPDLRIESLAFHPPRPSQDEPDTVFIVVRNDGNASASTSVTEVKVDGISWYGAGTPVLPAGADTVVSRVVPPQVSGDHAVEACADAGGSVTEGREDNNCLSSTLTVELGARPPELIAPPLPDTVSFGSAADSVRLAQEEVNSRIRSARATAARGTFLAPLHEGPQWAEEDSSCWSWSVPVGSCGYSYESCHRGSGFDWTLILSGFCGGEFLPDSVVCMRGNSDVYGLNGQCRFYAAQNPSVMQTIDWSMPDAYSGEWSFRDGDPASPLTAVLQWRGPYGGGSAYDWLLPEVSRWLLSRSAPIMAEEDTMRVFGGSGLGSLRQEISWGEGGNHGSWTIYPPDGSSTYRW